MFHFDREKMTYLPNLIKKIDNFYSLVNSMARLKKMAAPTTWTMPDDEEEEEISAGGDTGLTSEIENVANEISDQADDVSNELRLIATLYQKAIEINGGYSQLNKAISIALANIDSLIDESDGVIGENVRDAAEDILEKVASDLRQRAKSSPNQMAEAQAMNELRTVKQNFNQQEARQEMEAQKSVYEKGKPGAETGHGISTKVVAETPEKYAREIARLATSYEAETNLNNKENIKKLSEVLVDLIKQIKVVRTLQDELKITPNDEAKVNQFNDATLLLEELRRKRQNLNRILNDFLLKKEQSELYDQLNKSRNPVERQWLEEKIKLLDLRLDTRLLKKRDEIKARKTKINAMGVVDEHGDFQSLNIPDNERMALDRAVQLGRDMTLSKAKYDRGRTVEHGKDEGRDYIPVADPLRGGPRQKLLKNIDLNKSTFPGMLKKLRDLNNTATADARKYIMRPKEKGDPVLEPFIERVSAAIRKKDNAAKYKAINELKVEIKKTLVNSSSLKGYLQVLRLSPHFKKIEESLFSFKDKQNENGSWQLSADDKQQLLSVVSNIHRITELYSKYYQTKGGLHEGPSQQPYQFFKGVITALLAIDDYIINNMLQSPAIRVEEPATQYRVEGPAEEENIEQTEEAEENPLLQRMRLMNHLIETNYIKMAQHTKEEKRKYDRERTIEKAKHHGQVEVPLGTPQRGGSRTQNRYNLAVADFSGIVHKLQESINSGLGTLKQNLIRPRFEGDPALKSYVDAISNAVSKKDMTAKYHAIRTLKEQIATHLSKNEEVKRLEKGIRLLPIFRKLKDELKIIASWEQGNQLILNEKQKQYVFNLMQKIERLQQLYSKYYSQPGQMDISFGPAIEKLLIANNYLKDLIEENK